MGQIKSGSITPNTIVNGDVAAGANIESSKLQHNYIFTHDFGKHDAEGSIAAVKYTICIPQSVVTITSVKAWLVDSGTSTDIDFDLLVNNASILTSAINIVHGTGDQTAVTGSIATPTVTGGNAITLSIATVTSSTGALGPRMEVSYNSYVSY